MSVEIPSAMKTVELVKLLVVLALWAPFRAQARRLYDARDVQDKSPAEIIRLRNFGVEEHYVTTQDGYIIYLARVVHPDEANGTQPTLKRPVLFNHGLFESPTFFLLNSRDSKPRPLQSGCRSISIEELLRNTGEFLNGPLMLANQGYSVWLMSMRGTDLSQRNVKLSPKQPEFWDYSLNEFARYDLPAAIGYIRNKTKAEKVAYIGHSQATFVAYALLASQPEYADIMEPVITLAPVAYFGDTYSIARLLYVGSLITKDNGPFPPSAQTFREVISNFCESYDRISFRALVCRLAYKLIAGPGKVRTLKGYYSAIPYTMYDYGPEGNQEHYGTELVPAYPIENIRSKSIVLISGKKDALAAPTDVDRFEEDLPVPVYRHIRIEGFNHFDLVLDDDVQRLVFAPILEIIEHFENEDGLCTNETANEI